MSFDEKHIDKSIKSKMDNVKIAPPSEVWGNIEGALLKNKIIVRRNKIIGTAATVVTTVVVATLLIIFLSADKKNKIKPYRQEIHTADSIIISDTTTRTSITSNTTVSKQENTSKQKNAIQNNRSVGKIKTIDNNDFVATAPVETVNTPVQADTSTVKTAPAEKVVVKKVIKKPVYIVQQDTIYKVDTLSKKKKW